MHYFRQQWNKSMRTCFAFNFSFFSLYMYIYICIIIANQFQEFQTNVNYATLYIWNDCIIIKPSLDKKVVKLALYIYIYHCTPIYFSSGKMYFETSRTFFLLVDSMKTPKRVQMIAMRTPHGNYWMKELA